jgi:hypothetical protein
MARTATLTKRAEGLRTITARAVLVSLALSPVLAYAQSPATTPSPPGAAPSPPPPAARSAAPAVAPPPVVPPESSAAPPNGSPPPNTSPPAAPPAASTTAPAPMLPALQPPPAPPPPAPEAPVAAVPPPEAPPMPPPAGPPHVSHVRSYVLLGVGGASLLVGTIFGLMAVSTKNDIFDSSPTYGQADAVRTQTLVADVGLGLGVVLVASGTAFLLVDRTPKQATTAPAGVAHLRLEPVFGPKRGGCAVTFAF